MARVDWLRTFVAVCQSGSISEAARLRNLSQPAATNHVRSLEAAVDTPLFVRRRDGVTPTEAGRRLFAQVADPLDHLQSVLAGLDAGSVALPGPPLRIGTSPELFAGLLTPRLSALGGPVRAVFGSEEDLMAGFVNDEIDLLVSGAPVTRKVVTNEVVAHERYALVGGSPGDAVGSVAELSRALTGAPWVAYSNDLPRTRRFWKQHLGHPFDADVRLVAPDLRVVLSAVEAGVGASLLPTMVCEGSLARGSVHELFDVRGLVDPRPFWASYRARPEAFPGFTDFLRQLRSG